MLLHYGAAATSLLLGNILFPSNAQAQSSSETWEEIEKLSACCQLGHSLRSSIRNPPQRFMLHKQIWMGIVAAPSFQVWTWHVHQAAACRMVLDRLMEPSIHFHHLLALFPPSSESARYRNSQELNFC